SRIYFISLCLLHTTHVIVSLIFLRPPISPPFPYTTLFRSAHPRRRERSGRRPGGRAPAGRRLPRNGPGQSRRIHRDCPGPFRGRDRKSTRLNSSHGSISYAVFCLKKKKKK